MSEDPDCFSGIDPIPWPDFGEADAFRPSAYLRSGWAAYGFSRPGWRAVAGAFRGCGLISAELCAEGILMGRAGLGALRKGYFCEAAKQKPLLFGQGLSRGVWR